MTEVHKQAVIKLLEDAEKGKFFGEVVFKLRNGEIYQIIKGQSLMLDELVQQ